MSDTSKGDKVSLLHKFCDVTGLRMGFFKKAPAKDEDSEYSGLIKELRERDLKTSADVKVAISVLREINTPEACDEIIDVLSRSIIDGKSAFFDEECFLDAVDAFKNMDRPAHYLGKLLYVESSWHEARDSAREVLGMSDAGGFSHEDMLIDEIVKIGGREAEKVLDELVSKVYPDKAEGALRRLSYPDNVKVLDDHRQG